ncbi:MAG: hypothetical protein LC664_08430 [Flavobacteriales bacterium]|nr:hypothetical protein [Flavobacteriales bacterium]
MEKTIIKSIQTPLPNLKLTKKRVPFACEYPRRKTTLNNGLLVYSDTYKPVSRYRNSQLTQQSILVFDSKKMHNEFKILCKKIPNRPGNLIVFGQRKNEKIIIDVIRSGRELRRDFKDHKNALSRWDWCLQQLRKNGYSSLSFELAKEK